MYMLLVDPHILNTYVHKEKITLFVLINTFILGRSVQFSSVAQLCPTLCDPMDCSTPVLSVHHQLTEYMQTHVHWVGDAIQPSHPLLSQYWSFRFRISPSSEYSGLIFFIMDWLNLAVQGTLKNLLQHHSLKASILPCSAFFIVCTST